MSAVAMTGGTAAPGGKAPASKAPAMRQKAAVKAVSRTPSVHVHVNVGQQHQSKSSARGGGRSSRPAAAAKPAAGPTAFNPMAGFLTSQQLGQLANNITQQNLQSELSPLRQQAGELRNQEGTVAKRYGGYSEAANQMLGGIAHDTETSAKTFENQAADAALKAGQNVNQAGQTAAGQTAGYLDPQVQGELNAEGKLAGTVGAGQNQFAASQGANATNTVGALRGAAVQRALEAQRGITQDYGAKLGANQAQQNSLIAKQPADAKSLAVELGQKQFVDSTTLQGLGIKQATAQQGQQKIKLTAQQNKEHDRLSERGQNITAEHNAAQARLDERKLAETERHNRASEKTSAERAAAAVKKANGGLTTTQQDKVSGELGTAYSIVQQLRTGNINPQEIRNTLTTGSLRRRVPAETSTGKKYEKEVTYHYPKVGNQTLISAAFELWNYHKVSPQTVKALQGMGMTVPSNWTDGTFKGF